MSNIFFGLTKKEYQESKPKKDVCEEDDSDSSDSFIDSFNNLTGGQPTLQIPNGGFPPLKLCDTDIDISNLDVKSVKNQAFASNPNKLNIHKILEDSSSDKIPLFNIPT